MKRLLLPVLILSALAVGCKPASLAGTYNGGQAGDIILSEDGDFELKSPNPLGNVKGKWKEEGGKVVIKPELVAGQPVATVLSQMDRLKALGMKQAQIDEQKALLNEIDGTLDKDRKVITITVAKQSIAFTKAAKS